MPPPRPVQTPLQGTAGGSPVPKVMGAYERKVLWHGLVQAIGFARRGGDEPSGLGLALRGWAPATAENYLSHLRALARDGEEELACVCRLAREGKSGSWMRGCRAVSTIRMAKELDLVARTP